jgi:hypothetical protein
MSTDSSSRHRPYPRHPPATRRVPGRHCTVCHHHRGRMLSVSCCATKGQRHSRPGSCSVNNIHHRDVHVGVHQDLSTSDATPLTPHHHHRYAHHCLPFIHKHVGSAGKRVVDVSMIAWRTAYTHTFPSTRNPIEAQDTTHAATPLPFDWRAHPDHILARTTIAHGPASGRHTVAPTCHTRRLSVTLATPHACWGAPSLPSLSNATHVCLRLLTPSPVAVIANVQRHSDPMR